MHNLKNKNTQKYSIFGSTGFIGSRFCELYQDEVIRISRNDYSAKSDNILYLISTTDNYNVFSDPFLDIETNLKILVKVLEEFKGRKGIFNFISSWFVYGDTDLPAQEESCCYPKGFYSITKKAAEELLISYCQTFDIRYRIMRLCNVYGKGDEGVSKKKNALQYLLGQLKENEPINLYSGGEIIRDYMHVDDICRAIKLVTEEASLDSIINIGSGNPYRIKDIIEIAYKELESQSKISSIKPPEFHRIVQVKDMYLDITKLKSLGFQPELPIDKGIKTLCRQI